MAGKTSFIWNLYNIDEADETFAKCLLCKKRIKRGKDKKNFSTTPLMRHAEAKHTDEYLVEKQAMEVKQAECTNPPPPKIQKLNAMASSYHDNTVQQKMPLSLEGLKVWDINDHRAQAINRKVIDMIVSDNQPFSIVEDAGFIRLMAHVQPKYCLPSRRYFSETMLPRLYEETRLKAVILIEKADSLSFTSDIWTASTSNESFVSLSAHWIDGGFTRRSLVLSAQHFPQSHTGLNICQMFQKMFTDWNIQESRQHCLIRDGASNMTLASSLVGIQSVHCFIHALQLVVHDAVLSQRAVADMLARTRRIVTHFSHSSLACTALKELQMQSSGDSNAVLLPVQDVSTRWNSTYLMCERAMKIKRSLQLYMADHDQIPELSANDWSLMEKMLFVLKPFFDLTKQLSSEDASISRVIADVQMLDGILAKLSDEQTTGIKTTRDELRKALATRFGHKNPNDPESIFNRKPVSLASILDPRFKMLFFPSGMKLTLKAQIVDELSKLAAPVRPETVAANADVSANAVGGTNNDVSSTSQSQSQPASADVNDNEGNGVGDKEEDLWQSAFETFAAAAEQDVGNDTSEDELETLTEQLDQYLGLPLHNRTGNPLLWWKEHATQFPTLAKLARKYLATPASSVYSERLFSEYGNIYEEKRSRLLPQTGEKILFLHHN